MTSIDEKDQAKVRIDKWLWAARFFKTRSLCKDAINGGKVELQNQKAKPNKSVNIGDTITIRQGWDMKTVIVDQLSEKRGNAASAALLYHETEESLEKRQHESELRKTASDAIQYDKKKPDKKDRRKIIQFNIKNQT